MFENIVRTLMLWTVGFFGGLIFSLLKIFSRIEVRGYKLRKLISLMRKGYGLIVWYNHPSLWEPGLLPFLFFPWYLFFCSMIPYSTPDKGNYYDKWWFWIVRLVSIPIVREGKGKMSSLKALVKAKRAKKIIIMAPEGGRTYKGSEFKVLENREIRIRTKKEISLDNGLPKIRRFHEGIKPLLKLEKVLFIIVWNKGGDEVMPNKEHVPKGPYFLFPNLRKKISITIGEPFERIESLDKLEDEMLKLSQM